MRQRDRTAGNRRVEHRQAALGEFGGDRATRVRRDGAHVDIDGAALQAGDDAVAAERDRVHRRRIGDDREHDVRARRGRARRRRVAHAGGDERLGFRLAAVPTGDGMTGSHEPGDDAGTHRAEPNETDIHAFDLATSREAR